MGELGEGLSGLRGNIEDRDVFQVSRRVLTARDGDWTEVAGNLQKARKIWVWMTRILIWERVDLKVSGCFFKAVVQAVLVFGAEMWILNPRMERALSSFQHRFA